MYNIRTRRIVFELCLSEKKKERTKKNNKEDEQNWLFPRLVFSALLKVSGTYRVDLAIEWPREVVCRLFALLCFFFLGAAPIPYVQAAILK